MAEQTRDRPSPTEFSLETARIASGLKGEDATDATEAETPSENLRRIRGEGEPGAAIDEAIERATASVGQDDGRR